MADQIKAERFYSPKEAAAILGCHRAKLDRWKAQWPVKQQGPRWVKLGGSIRYPESEIVAYQNRLKAEAGISTEEAA